MRVPSFKTLFERTKELAKLAKEPFIKARAKRALDAAMDNAKLQEMDAEEALEKHLVGVIEGTTGLDAATVLKHLNTIESAERTVKTLEEFKNQFFAE